ncbi:MAG: helix-turn-helix transcriptional regulator [Rhodoblastus sp.]
MTTTDSPNTRHPTVDLKTLLRERGLKLADLAARVGRDKSNVTRWAQTRVPAENVIDVETATGIPRHMIRPDLYAPPEAAE